jgi:hypothetical protein
VRGIPDGETGARRVNLLEPVKVNPFPFDFDMGFVNLPGIVHMLEIWANSFFEFGSIVLKPTMNG